MTLLRSITLAASLSLLGCSDSEISISSDYRIATETSGAQSYLFEARSTPMVRDVDHPAMIEDVNAVLKIVSLPPVDRTMHLAKPPEFRPHRTSRHRWPSYPGGWLEIQRKICNRSSDKKSQYSCISKITHHIEAKPEDAPPEADVKSVSEAQMPRF